MSILERADEGERRNLPSEQCILDYYKHAVLDGKGHWYEGGSHLSKTLCLLNKHNGFVLTNECARLPSGAEGYCFYDEPNTPWTLAEDLAKTARVVVVSCRPPTNCDPTRWVHHKWTGTEYTSTFL